MQGVYFRRLRTSWLSMTGQLYSLRMGLLAGAVIVVAGWVIIFWLASAFPVEPCPDSWSQAARINFQCD